MCDLASSAVLCSSAVTHDVVRLLCVCVFDLCVHLCLRGYVDACDGCLAVSVSMFECGTALSCRSLCLRLCLCLCLCQCDRCCG